MRRTVTGIAAGVFVGGAVALSAYTASVAAAVLQPVGGRAPAVAGPVLPEPVRPVAATAPSATAPSTAQRSGAAPGAGGLTACEVEYGLTAGRPGGFLAQVRIRNTGGSDISGWHLVFTLPPGQSVATAWGVVHSQQGSTVTFTDAAFNGLLPAGATVTLGFAGVTTDEVGTARPSGFRLNGTACVVR